ncbi:helix-turn-helix transcriptional regulator [Mesorhizobium atlanticum]
MTLISGRNDARPIARPGMVAAGAGSRTTTTFARSASRKAIRPITAGTCVRPCLNSITGMLERIGCGWLVLSEAKECSNGMRLPKPFSRPARILWILPGDLSAALRSLIAGVPAHFAAGSLSWIVIRSGGDRPVVISEEGVVTPDGSIIVALLDRQPRTGPNPETLRKMFGLTGAETQLALRLASGDAPLEIAERNRLSRTTIRTQLASLFAKTETRRQAELVALLGRDLGAAVEPGPSCHMARPGFPRARHLLFKSASAFPGFANDSVLFVLMQFRTETVHPFLEFVHANDCVALFLRRQRNPITPNGSRRARYRAGPRLRTKFRGQASAPEERIVSVYGSAARRVSVGS